MISLAILAVLLVVPFILNSWVMSLAARWLGSTRGHFRVGLLATALIIVVNVAFLVVALKIPLHRAVPPLLHAVMLLLGQATATLLLLSRVFRLSLARALGPFVVEASLAVAQIFLAVWVIKPYVIESFVNTSASMAPTIEAGDCFTVLKVAAPRRWDIVAYRTTDRPPAIFCHRLVGLPGERLRFENGAVYADDVKLIPPPVVAGRYHASPPVTEEFVRYRDGGTIRLGADEFFFVGDNVDRANDSRLQGPTARHDLVGVVDLTYWPFERVRIHR